MDYLFLSTVKRELVSKAKRTFAQFSLYEKYFDDRIVLIFSSDLIRENFKYRTIINDLESDELNKDHSLISRVDINNSKFFCTSDFFGIQTHYYYCDKESFLSSNNIFLISYLIDPKISEEAVFDSLFFKKPRGEKTWFVDIKCLMPCEQLVYDIKLHNCTKSKTANLYDIIFKKGTNDYIDAFVDFFDGFKNITGCKDIAMSLSAGCDSRTVFTGLLTTGKDFKTYSWGSNNYLETYKIKKFVKKLGFENLIIDFDNLTKSYDDYTGKAFYHTSGLLASVHYYYYYSKLPSNICLFEGYLGSEFVKGEQSDGMYTEIYYDIIKNDLSVKDSIYKYFPDINIKWRERFIDYIEYSYRDCFKNIDTEEGKIEFQKYLLEHIPSKIFGGVFQNGFAFGHKYYLPYISPRFLNSLFSSGYGIKNNISLRNDFPGSIKIVQAQAKIVKRLNKRIYKSVLDRNIKYSESFLPIAVSKSIRLKRILVDKIRVKKYSVVDQVDFKNIIVNSNYHRKSLNSYLEPYANSNSSNKFFSYVSLYLNLIDKMLSDKYMPSR